MQMFCSLPAFIGTKVIGAEPMKEGEFLGKFRGVHNRAQIGADGYHVQYLNPDNSVYDSWSPKDVFESAYRSLDGGLTFGDAIFFLKQGKKVARKGWNGRGMHVQYQIPDTNSKMTFPYLYIVVPGCTEGTRLLPWQPAQGDMFSEDWCTVE